jgi:hypothetical protein
MYINKILIFLSFFGIFSQYCFSQVDNIYGFQNNFPTAFSGWPYGIVIGEKHQIWHYRANVRLSPSRNSDVVAVLSLFDEVEVLEKTEIEETINGLNAYWYKVRFGNIIGYTFGYNMAYSNVEWWTLEQYEEYEYPGDFLILKRVVDDNGQTWLVVEYMGK